VLNRLLFLATLTLAIALATLVVVAPWLESDKALAGDYRARVISLFAGDSVVRRTALASSAGLLATAFVFFRPKKRIRPT